MSSNEENRIEDGDATQSGDRHVKYLTFVVGKESFGVPVMKVREIVRVLNITPVPNSPTYVKGVVNLRGKIIPILDLRIKLEMGEGVIDKRSCIVVVQLELEGGETGLMGLIVDGMEEVVTLDLKEVEKAPDFGTRLSTDYITGVCKVKGKVKTLLDIDRTVGMDVLSQGVAA